MDSIIIDKLDDVIAPIVEQYGFELVHIEYRNESGGMVLRVYIDKDGGITIDDCSGISREISAVLDIKDLIKNRYRLEVSSPGLRRPLKKEVDFRRFAGKKVKIKTKELISERKNFLGILKGFENKEVIVQIDEQTYNLPFNSITKANLELES